MKCLDIFGVFLDVGCVISTAALIFGISLCFFQNIWSPIIISLIGAIIVTANIFKPEERDEGPEDLGNHWR